MDTDRLRHFCAVVETGTVRRAAELLGLSHSGVSKSIRALQDDIGVPLFLPDGRGIAITDEGQRLYERSVRLIEEIEALPSWVASSGEHRAFRIGTFEVFSTYFFGELARAHLPATSLAVLELVPGEIEQALMTHRIDAGITYIPAPQRGIDFLQVGSLRMGVYKRRGSFSRQRLDELPFAVPTTSIPVVPMAARSLDLWPDHERARQVRYHVTLLETGLELCRQGVAVLFAPSFVVALHNRQVQATHRLVEHPWPKQLTSITAPIYIAKRASTEESTLIKKLARALRKLTQG